MTENLSDIYVRKHSLIKCLSEFSGAKGDSDEEKIEFLSKPFAALAKKMIYGGYFEVSSKRKIYHRIYIHSVEFYYHEEFEGGLRDWIVYHRNTLSGDMKDSFLTGTFNSHESGVDITFEDQSNRNNPTYRASALIRSFKVTLGNSKKFEEFKNKPEHIKMDLPYVELFPTHLYDYLFMRTPFTDMRIRWVSTKKPFGKLYRGRRINVFEYDYYIGKDKKKHLMKKKNCPDIRKWAFSSEKMIITPKDSPKYEYEALSV